MRGKSIIPARRTMFEWLTEFRERQRRVREDADALMCRHGERAYDEAHVQASRAGAGHRRKHWDRVRREIGRREFAAVSRNLIWSH